ncbi:MAG TPA: orotidine-5'-phosphate decarboxylase [Candidatus Saccharimonadales bacterium]|nr:orotidine-5'-phosphate decarboxylase [Candidatus Saccharimonadales bacterium]
MAEAERNFMNLLKARWAESKFLCVGLDSATARLPTHLQNREVIGACDAQLVFNKAIIDATHDLVCAYKPNLAFYAPGNGAYVLRDTVRYINNVAPGVPVILDAKWGDIGNTNNGYINHLRWYGADAVTINPYVGAEVESKDGVQPFLDLADKGVVVLCKTSNRGSGQFQDSVVEIPEEHGLGRLLVPQGPLYEKVARTVANEWNDNHNCGLVVGATYPELVGEIREAAGDGVYLLLPGVGSQGGKAGNVVQAAADSSGQGFMINNGSAILFASSGEDFAEAARAKAEANNDEILAALAA